MIEWDSELNIRKINPGYRHEERRDILSDIAILSGYDTELRRGLPDGTIPDVLRIDSSCGSIFLGEAKDSETPGISSTKQRLLNYLSWFRLLTNERKGSLFVICVGNNGSSMAWRSTLAGLALSSGIMNSITSIDLIDNENCLVSLRLV